VKTHEGGVAESKKKHPRGTECSSRTRQKLGKPWAHVEKGRINRQPITEEPREESAIGHCDKKIGPEKNVRALKKGKRCR